MKEKAKEVVDKHKLVEVFQAGDDGSLDGAFFDRNIQQIEE